MTKAVLRQNIVVVNILFGIRPVRAHAAGGFSMEQGFGGLLYK